MSTTGDLGRRVTERRLELELNPEEVASRAGMSTTYLRALEASPSPELPRAALWRLAAALDFHMVAPRAATTAQRARATPWR